MSLKNPTTTHAAERAGRLDAAAGLPLNQQLWETASKPIWEAYRRGYDGHLREGNADG